MEAIELLNSFFSDHEQYDVHEEIGQGTYSEVRRGVDRKTGEQVALKEMFLNEDKTLPTHVERELMVLKNVDSPFILPLRGVISKGFGITLVLPLCQTDLRQLLEVSKIPPPVTRAILAQLFSAVDALHKAGIAHRDLAPANILFADDGSVRLGDFGQSQQLDDHQQLTPGVGTRWYRSPELLFGARSYSSVVDCWSLGMLAVHMMNGQALCQGISDIDQICKLHDALGDINLENCPPAANWSDFGKLLFPASPPKAWETLVPRADNDALELCKGLLTYDPRTRWTAEKALSCSYFDAGKSATQQQVAKFIRSSVQSR